MYVVSRAPEAGRGAVAPRLGRVETDPPMPVLSEVLRREAGALLIVPPVGVEFLVPASEQDDRRLERQQLLGDGAFDRERHHHQPVDGPPVEEPLEGRIRVR